MITKVDFRYRITDERLRAYAKIPLLDRLRWLDEIRAFTLLVRAAPIVERSTPSSTQPPS